MVGRSGFGYQTGLDGPALDFAAQLVRPVFLSSSHEHLAPRLVGFFEQWD
jgi:hypothetical protein